MPGSGNTCPNCGGILEELGWQRSMFKPDLVLLSICPSCPGYRLERDAE